MRPARFGGTATIARSAAKVPASVSTVTPSSPQVMRRAGADRTMASPRSSASRSLIAPGATDDPVLLGAARGAEHPLQAVAGGDVGQPVQQRHGVGLGGEDGGRGDLVEQAGLVGAHPAVQPRGEGGGVEGGGVGRGPGGLQVDGGDQLVQGPLGLEEVGEGEGAERRGVAPEPLDLALRQLDDAVAVVVGGVPLQAELVDEGVDPVLGRPDPLAADLDGDAGDLVVQRAPPDPVPGLQHHDGAPRLLEPPTGGQPGDPTPHDHHIGSVSHRRPRSGSLVFELQREPQYPERMGSVRSGTHRR